MINKKSPAYKAWKRVQPRSSITADLRTPKYKRRVETSKKLYNRKKKSEDE